MWLNFVINIKGRAMDNKVLGILEQCEQLQEYQKKQIATILMASTLESLSLSQVIKVLVDDMANKLDTEEV